MPPRMTFGVDTGTVPQATVPREYAASGSFDLHGHFSWWSIHLVGGVPSMATGYDTRAASFWRKVVGQPEQITGSREIRRCGHLTLISVQRLWLGGLPMKESASDARNEEIFSEQVTGEFIDHGFFHQGQKL